MTTTNPLMDDVVRNWMMHLFAMMDDDVPSAPLHRDIERPFIVYSAEDRPGYTGKVIINPQAKRCGDIPGMICVKLIANDLNRKRPVWTYHDAFKRVNQKLAKAGLSDFSISQQFPGALDIQLEYTFS